MKKRYNFTCPNCGYEQSAAPSILMEMSYNNGCGSCLECKSFLHLMIVPDLNGDAMEAILWDDYMKKEELVEK